MKSGDFSVSRDDAYHRERFAEITDPNFVCRTFATRAALVGRTLVSGHRVTKDYHGGPFDHAAFDLVEGRWDHEHCSICWFTIRDGHSYWENGKRITLLCDACYEAFMKPNQLPDPTSPSVTPPAEAGGAPSVAADH
jgi:hypothetical protein